MPEGLHSLASKWFKWHKQSNHKQLTCNLPSRQIWQVWYLPEAEGATAAMCLPDASEHEAVIYMSSICMIGCLMLLHVHYLYSFASYIFIIYSYIIILYILIYEKNIYRQLRVHPNTHGTISCSKQQTNRLVAWRWSSSSSHLGMANASRHGWAAVEGQHGSPSFATDLRQSNRFAVLFTSAAPFFGCNSEKTSEAEASPIMDHVSLGLCFEVQNLSLRQSMKLDRTWWTGGMKLDCSMMFHAILCNSTL